MQEMYDHFAWICIKNTIYQNIQNFIVEEVQIDLNLFIVKMCTMSSLA